MEIDCESLQLTDKPTSSSCKEEIEDVQKQKKILEDELQQLETHVQEFHKVNQNRSNMEALFTTRPIEEQRLVELSFKPMTDACLEKFKQTVQIVKQNLEDLYKSLGNLIHRLIEEVKYWQRQLALKYSELAADVNIDNVAHWAAATGKCLQDILQTNIPQFKKAIITVQGSGDSVYEPIREKFHKQLVMLFRRTFIVTEQTRWNVKTLNSSTTQTPEIKLRILGAEALDILDGVEIQTCFVLEKHINECYNKDSENLDVDTLKEKSNCWKFKKGQTSKFEKGQNYRAIRYGGRFYSIEMKAIANRKKQVPVFMEKFRFLFCCNLENNKLWTMSMPLVVTTGSVQDCQCLASVMWQCFSTNSVSCMALLHVTNRFKFAIPVEPVTDLPWTTIAAMLQSKIANLPSTQKLSEDNLQHLKERLTWNVEDDGKISLQQFCNVPLIRNTSTPPEQVLFWQWFLSLYNLIRTDIGRRNLLEYWNKGWIEGLISTEMAEKKLQGCARGRHGMFLLRFSDWSIKESQSKSGVMGKLVLSVLIKCNGTSKKVQHIGPVKEEDLKNQTLASYILSLKDGSGKKICHYLYSHSEVHIDVLFKDPTHNSEPPGHGYVPIVNTPTVELEKGLSKLELGEKRSVSSPDLEDVKNCIATGGTGVAEPKRLKNGYCDPIKNLYHSQVANQHVHTKSVETPMLRAILTSNQCSSGVTQSKVMTGNEASEHVAKNRNETFDDGHCDSGNKNHSDQIPTVVFDDQSITKTSKSSAGILKSPDSRIFDRAISSETPAGGNMLKPQLNNAIPYESFYLDQHMPEQINADQCSLQTFTEDAHNSFPVQYNSSIQLAGCQLNLVRPVSGSGQNTVSLPYQPNLSVADCQSKLVIPVSETTYENHGLTNNIGGHIYQQTNVNTNSEQDFSGALDQAGPDLTNVNINCEQDFSVALDQAGPDLTNVNINCEQDFSGALDQAGPDLTNVNINCEKDFSGALDQAGPDLTNVNINCEQDFSGALDQAGPDLTNVNINCEQDFSVALDQAGPDLTNVNINCEQDFSVALDQAGPDLTNVNINFEQDFSGVLDQTSPDMIDKDVIMYLRSLPVDSKQEIIKMLQEDVNESEVPHDNGKKEETDVPWDGLDTEESFQDLADFILENDNE